MQHRRFQADNLRVEQRTSVRGMAVELLALAADALVLADAASHALLAYLFSFHICHPPHSLHVLFWRL